MCALFGAASAEVFQQEKCAGPEDVSCFNAPHRGGGNADALSCRVHFRFQFPSPCHVILILVKFSFLLCCQHALRKE